MVGGGGAGRDRQARKRAVLKAALRWLLGGREGGGEEGEEEEAGRRATTMMLKGMPEDESELDDLVAKQTWGLGRAMPEAAWPRLEGVVLPSSVRVGDDVMDSAWPLETPRRGSFLRALIGAGMMRSVDGGLGLRRKELAKLGEGLRRVLEGGEGKG